LSRTQFQQKLNCLKYCIAFFDYDDDEDASVVVVLEEVGSDSVEDGKRSVDSVETIKESGTVIVGLSREEEDEDDSGSSYLPSRASRA